MRAVVDALWEALCERGVSWVGFYLDVSIPDAPPCNVDTTDDSPLVLGPHRDKPACSPIGLHGVCGQALRTCTTRIVDDVSELGAQYVACDPRDRSEIVVPLVDETGVVWGVLDLDSWEPRSFDRTDEMGLKDVLRSASLLPR